MLRFRVWALDDGRGSIVTSAIVHFKRIGVVKTCGTIPLHYQRVVASLCVFFALQVALLR